MHELEGEAAELSPGCPGRDAARSRLRATRESSRAARKPDRRQSAVEKSSLDLVWLAMAILALPFVFGGVSLILGMRRKS